MSREKPFAGLSEAKPPEDLRGRVLQAAGEALRRESAADPWTRIWESRPARLAWSAGVVALALCHLMVPAEPTASDRDSLPMARTAIGENGELAAVTALPRLSLDARPAAGRARPEENSS
jgi:hypothetical protein